jgi:hypothetical protein
MRLAIQLPDAIALGEIGFEAGERCGWWRICAFDEDAVVAELPDETTPGPLVTTTLIGGFWRSSNSVPFASSAPFEVICDDADGPANWDSSSSSTLSNTPFSRMEDASELPKSLLGSVARLGMGDRDTSDTMVLVPAV